MGKALVTISLLTLSFGYILYSPLPEDLMNPWRGRKITLLFDTLETLAKGASMVTGKESSFYVYKWTRPMVYLVHQNFPELECVVFNGSSMVEITNNKSRTAFTVFVTGGYEKTKTMQMNGVKTRLYRRKSLTGSIPAVVYFHGGGWVMGDIDGIDGLSVKLALATNMTIIAVNYRKAPVQPYPAPFQDCLNATQYVLKNAQDLGLDSSRVFVAGDSAGGNLAAAVSLKLSSEDPSVVPRLKGQVLLSPVLQAMTFNNTSYRESPRIILTQERMIFFWTAYLGIPFTKQTLNAMKSDRHISTDLQKSRFGSYAGKGQSVTVTKDYDATLANILDRRLVDPYLAPLMAEDNQLRKMPATFIVASQYEQLKDEIVLFADRLRSTGVSTDFRLLKGQTHLVLPLVGMPSVGFDNSDMEEVASNVAKFLVKSAKMD